jgi:surface polysaccharide O-acyltransferase-like enzyme
MAGTPMWMRVGFLYLYGGSQINQALWFVPVMCVIYLMAPLFWQMLKHRWSFAVLCVLLPLALLEHRPLAAKYHNFALVLYFLPAYLLGMWIGLHRVRVIAATRRFGIAVGIAIVAIIAGHFSLTTYTGTYVDDAFSGTQGLIDWIYVQKILIFPLLMTALQALDKVKMPALDYIATCSFGIYFVHIYILTGFLKYVHAVEGGVFSTLAVTVLTAGASLLLVHLVRSMFPSRSRMLVGS